MSDKDQGGRITLGETYGLLLDDLRESAVLILKSMDVKDLENALAWLCGTTETMRALNPVNMTECLDGWKQQILDVYDQEFRPGYKPGRSFERRMLRIVLQVLTADTKAYFFEPLKKEISLGWLKGAYNSRNKRRR